jgi:ABC-type thiamin/hydroxymethylpyrimidine transport system permease subunit
MPSSDTIKNLTSSFAAVFIVGYGMWQIGQYIAGGIISPDAGLAILGPLIGGAATWLLNRESQTQAVRSQDRAFALGAKAGTTTVQNAENVQGGDPTIVNGKVK